MLRTMAVYLLIVVALSSLWGVFRFSRWVYRIGDAAISHSEDVPQVVCDPFLSAAAYACFHNEHGFCGTGIRVPAVACESLAEFARRCLASMRKVSGAPEQKAPEETETGEQR